MKKNNILLINFGGIGDEVLFLPVIKSIKNRYPDANISLCLESRSKSIKDLCPDINNLIFADIKSKNKYFELLKLYFNALFGHYDVVISSGGNKLIPLLLFFTGIKKRIGYKNKSFTSSLLTEAVELNQKQYAGMMYHDLVKIFAEEEYSNPEISVKKSEKTEGMILVHPGVSKMSIKKNIIKNHGNKKWAELVKRLLNEGYKVCLAGGPDDKECIEEIQKEIKDTDCTNLFNAYGKTKNLKDLAELIAGSKLVICSDSAPMHIAIASNTPTVAIFGPTDEKKLVPEKENIKVVKTNVNCRPCLWDKRQTSCDTKECLNIETDDIISAVKELLP